MARPLLLQHPHGLRTRQTAIDRRRATRDPLLIVRMRSSSARRRSAQATRFNLGFPATACRSCVLSANLHRFGRRAQEGLLISQRRSVAIIAAIAAKFSAHRRGRAAQQSGHRSGRLMARYAPGYLLALRERQCQPRATPRSRTNLRVGRLGNKWTTTGGNGCSTQVTHRLNSMKRYTLDQYVNDLRAITAKETDPVKITDLVAPLAKKFAQIARVVSPRISWLRR